MNLCQIFVPVPSSVYPSQPQPWPVCTPPAPAECSQAKSTTPSLSSGSSSYRRPPPWMEFSRLRCATLSVSMYLFVAHCLYVLVGPPPLLTHQCCRPPAAKLTLIYAWSLTGWQPRDGPARHKRRCYCVATVRVWPPYHRLCTILPATTAMPHTPPYAPMHLCTYPPGTAS